MTSYIAAYKGPGRWIDKLIRIACSFRHFEGVKYSHVEIMAGPPIYDKVTDTYSARCVAASKRDGETVRSKTIVFKDGHWDFHTIPNHINIYEAAMKLRGKNYDTWGAILSITPFHRAKADRYWCSQMIAELCGWKDSTKYDPHMIALEAYQSGGQFRSN